MIRLADIELFSRLEGADLHALGQAIEERHLSAGSTVCRRGEAGGALYAVAQGGVEVEILSDTGGGSIRVHLGPGQVFGEMALLSGQPISATVVTIRDSWLYVLDKDRFAALFEANPRLLTPFLHLLIDRLRHRSQLGGRSNGRCVLVVPPSPVCDSFNFGRALLDAVARYAPASIVVSAEDGEMPSAAPPQWPGELGDAPSAAASFDAPLDRFYIPAAVVVADLVHDERHVFDRGPAAVALLATTAIPGLFPPVRHEGRILVDGAVVSRIPIDLLHRRRCGLKIAVNVIPSAAHRDGAATSRAERLGERIGHFMGLRHVIAGSWELLAWWHGAAEAQSADFLIEPATDADSTFAFGSIDKMIAAGREATLAKAPSIARAVADLMRAGVP